MVGLLANIWHPVYANDLDAFIPEVWAQEGLLLLENNMVAANLVHRDFQNEIASFGDTVNTRLPAEFTGKRKTDADSVTVQDAVSPNVAVVLNQHLHTTFIVKDGEESKGFQTLRQVLLEPAMLSLAQMVDEVVLGNVYDFMTLDSGAPNVVGQLGVTPTKETVIGVREKMNSNKVPMGGRNLIVTSATEADLLAIDSFVTADKVGDEGTALREGSLGMKYGILHWMSQNTPGLSAGQPTLTDILINNAAGYPAGTTVLTVDGRVAGTAVAAGTWITIAGDDTPQRVVSSVGGGTPTSLTITPGLVNAVVDDAVITEYTPGAINQPVVPTGYASGYAKELAIDGVTVAPAAGQLLSIASGAVPNAVYSALSGATTTSVLLNKPLEAAAADNDVLGIGPAGQYNFGFHRNAMALVTRPLAAPASGAGALSFTASFNGLSMRVTITYDGGLQGHRVTCDMLCGIKTLDRRLGCVMLA